MNYYDELISNIDKLIQDKKYDDAKAIIKSELNLAYVPKDVESKLNNYLTDLNAATHVYNCLNDQDIEKYLSMDDDHQLLAVDELDKRNLRDYISTCSNYLVNGSYKNAKALLIDSLIRQEINHEFVYLDGDTTLNFNPSKLVTVENTLGYQSAYKLLMDTYLKEPSLFKMSLDLLYKECLLYLPKQADSLEGEICANKIVKYINKAFKC